MASYNLGSELTLNQITEFMSRLGRFGVSPEVAKRLMGDDDAMRAFVAKGLGDACRADFTLVHGLFTKPEDQLERVREWNKRFVWGLPDEAFNEAEKSVPVWPEEKLVAVAVVLVPYLADKANEDEEKTVTTGLERTFHELWARASAEQDKSWRWDGFDKAGPERLKLLKGIEHKPGLRWEVIDLGCNRNRKPMDVRSSESSPHAGILAAAALHPEWIKAMDCKNVPYVWAPGYEVCVSGERPWTGVPSLGFDGDYRGIRLRYRWCGRYGSRWAVPSFFRE